MKRLSSLLLILSLLLTLAACGGANNDSEGNGTDTMAGTTMATTTAPATEVETEPPINGPVLNGTSLSDYVIVYSDAEPDYNLRAATYLQTAMEERTGIRLEIVEDDTAEAAHEIVVGETNRAISTTLEAETENMQFALLADGGKVAMEGDFFKISAAAYYFVETYIPAEEFRTAVPSAVTVCEPIVEKAKNFIFLIGDGMGEYQTKLFDVMDAPTEGDTAYSDGEDIFYGYYFPYQGWSKTNSLSGVTDSAAGGTALACGYKTTNGRIGQNSTGSAVDSLTEIALWNHNMGACVMSTESGGGATPGSFSAHTSSRASANGIIAQQNFMAEVYGALFSCDYDYYTVDKIPEIEGNITAALDELSKNENGFFLMYEEAHIDKHCHSNDINQTFLAVLRFNQAIGRFMEYAFYNPDTFVLITADHETGGLHPGAGGNYVYSSGDHSGANVPVFVYGQGAEIFDGETVENTVLPITIAKTFWGEESFGDPKYEALS